MMGSNSASTVTVSVTVAIGSVNVRSSVSPSGTDEVDLLLRPESAECRGDSVWPADAHADEQEAAVGSVTAEYCVPVG